jgi:predicted transcriptional regulator
LVAKGLAVRVETPIKKGGRIYEYSPIPLELVKKRMKEVFEEWCKKAIKVLDEFPKDFEKH